MDSKAISVRIPPPLLAKLDELASIDYPQRNGKNPNRSQIILDALELYLENREPLNKPDSIKVAIVSLEDKLNTLSYSVEQRLERLENSTAIPQNKPTNTGGLSNAELARQLNMTPSTVSRWSTGKRKPPEDLDWEFNPAAKRWFQKT